MSALVGPAPDEFEDALGAWGHSLSLLDEPLRPHTLTDAWIQGLVAASVQAQHAKAWNGKYPVPLPFVLEMPCPFGHRTADRRDYARVRLLIEEDGWPVLDTDSPCVDCDARLLERWLLTCPRCERGEESDRHEADHDALRHWSETVDDGRVVCGDTSPLAWVIGEFERRAYIAEARWWIEHTEAAAESIRSSKLIPAAAKEQRIRLAIEGARRTLGAVSAVERKGAPSMTPEEAAKWLDGLRDSGGRPLVPEGATTREAWALVKTVPGRPTKNTVDAAQPIRQKRRATEA